MFLPFGPGIFGATFAVEPAFIADTDTFYVETFGVGTDLFYRSGRLYIHVFADIKMLTRYVESASAMAAVQVIFREILVFACGGAVHYD